MIKIRKYVLDFQMFAFSFPKSKTTFQDNMVSEVFMTYSSLGDINSKETTFF